MEKIQDEVYNLKIVKGNMNKAVGKIKENRITKNKRVNGIKQQIQEMKEVYKSELEEYMKEEQAYNKTHQEMIKLEEYIRNAVIYVKDKRSNMKHATSQQFLPAIKHDSEKEENYNVNETTGNNEPMPNTKDSLKHVKSVERLPQAGFFKKRIKKNNNNLFSPVRQSRNPALTQRTYYKTANNGANFNNLASPTTEDLKTLNSK